MKFFTRNLSMQFKRCQNFQRKNKLKKLILAKITRIPQISHVIQSCGWIKVTEPIKRMKKEFSERILCKPAIFEL